MKELVKNRKNKLVKATTFFMSMFVVAIMLLSSTVPAAVDQGTSTETKMKERAPLFSTQNTGSIQKTASRITLASDLHEVTQQAQPLGRDVVWIHYNDDTAEDALGLTAGGNWQIACRFTPDELGDYAGYGLTTVQFHFGYDSAPTDMEVNVIIYGEGDASGPGSVLYSEGFTATGLGWNVFTLAEPQPIGGDEDRWVAIEYVNQPAGQYPSGMTSGATAGKGDWVCLSGAWTEITVYGFDYDFMIWAGVEEGGPTIEHDMKLKSIDAPVTGDAADPIIPKVTVKNQGNHTETNVDVNLQIFQTALSQFYNEGFETWPPAGWTLYQDTYYYGYIAQSTGGKVGTYAMKMYCNNYNYPVVEADTMDFDGSAGNNILNFWHKQLTWGGDQDYLYIYVFNGISYAYVTGYFTSMDWTYETINLDNYITPTATMQVWFVGSLGYGYGIYLDDVTLSNMAVNDVYDDTYTIASIAAGATMEVSFADWTPAEWGNVAYQDSFVDYGVTAQTMLVGDLNPDNDATTDAFQLYYPFIHDVAVDAILEPVDDAMAQTFDVKVNIKNVGQSAVKDFFTQVEIGEVGIAGTWLNEQWTGCSSYYPPAGWTDEDSTYYYYGWTVSYSTYSGGTSPEGMLPYYYAHAGKKLISPAMDLRGQAGAALTFKSYINHFSGQGLYTLKAGVSTDNGATWTELWSVDPASSQQFLVDLQIPGGNQYTKIAFWFTGDPWYFNYWYLDDVLVQATYVISEYQWDQAVVDWFYPGETIEQTFHDWTPDHLLNEPYTSGVLTYGITAETQYAGDDNIANNMMGDGFKLTYLHDIGVSITSPNRLEDKFYACDALNLQSVWFEPTTPGTLNVIAPTGGTDFVAAACWAQGQWIVSCYNSGTLYSVDPDTGAFTTIGGSVANGYTGLGYTNGQLYGVTWAGSAANLYSIDIATGTSTLIGSCGYYLYIDIAISGAGVCYGHDIIADQICTIDLATGATTVVGPTGIYANYAQGASYDLGNDVMYLAAYTSGGELYTVDTATGHATLVGAFQGSTEIDGFAIPGSSQGPPKPTVFVKKGTTGAITATGKNVGTWEETSNAYAMINEFITDPVNATFVQDANVPGVVIAPLGGTTEINFGTMNWAQEGVYSLYVELPLGVDDKMSDNTKTVGIGSDGTAPVTTHTLTPAAPDGLAGWYISDVTVKLTASDPEVKGVKSGVAKIEYQIDGGSWTTYSAAFKVTTDSANHVVKYRATDKVGNVEAEKTIPSFKMDKTKPVIDSMEYEVTTEGLTTTIVTFTTVAHDDMSGCVKCEYYYNEVLQETVSGAGPYVYAYEWAPLTHVIIKAIVYDEAGWTIIETVEDPESIDFQGQQATQQSNSLQILGL
jgi:hypothetical protein